MQSLQDRFTDLTICNSPPATFSTANNENIVEALERDSFAMLTKKDITLYPLSMQIALYSRLHKLVQEGLTGYQECDKRQILKAQATIQSVLDHHNERLFFINLTTINPERIDLLLTTNPIFISGPTLFRYLASFTSKAPHHITIYYDFTMTWLERYKNTQWATKSEEALKQLLVAMKSVVSDDKLALLAEKMQQATQPMPIPSFTLDIDNLFSITPSRVARKLFQIQTELLLQFEEKFLLAPHWLFSLLPYSTTCDTIMKLAKKSIRDNQDKVTQNRQITRLYSITSQSYELGDYASAQLLFTALKQFEAPNATDKKNLETGLNWRILKPKIEREIRAHKKVLPPLYEIHEQIEGLKSLPDLLYQNESASLNIRKLEDTATRIKLLSACRALA
jgi:hypothetical protein